MLKALLSTVVEKLDSKKWIAVYAATIIACVLHLQFGLSIQDSLLLVSPLGLGVASQAHVDAAKEKAKGNSLVAGQVLNTIDDASRTGSSFALVDAGEPKPPT